MFKKIIRTPYLYIIILSYYGVWLIWNAIKLPAHVPTGIISSLPELGYNPIDNILRFLLAILLPPLVCLIAWMIIHKQPKKLWDTYHRLRWIRVTLAAVVVTACVLLCVAMGIVQNSTNPANNPTDTYGGPYSYALIDTFHEGETLGPAISYEQPNLAPYRNFVIVHGVFQDALRTVIAFKLFGTSIGAARAFAVILGIIAVLAYYALLLVLFRGNIFKSAIALFILALLMLPLGTLPIIGNYIYGVLLPFRDIATILFLITAIIGFRLIPKNHKKKLAAASLIIGFIVIAGFANSIDRAIFIAALSVVWLILAYIISPAKSFLKAIFLPYVIGAVIGIPVVGLAIKWAFSDFINYLLTISKYKEYLDGTIFTRPNVPITIILLISAGIITAFGAVIINTLGKSAPKRTNLKTNLHALRIRIMPLVQKHSITILLAATGLIFLRSAVGRADPSHWVYSVQWLYLLLTYVGITYFYYIFKNKEKVINFVAVVLLGCFLIFYISGVKGIDIRTDTFPVNIPDSDFMRTDYIQTANYLKKNLKGNESFVTLTSEASWYYFVGKPSPIKYPVIWYAFTKDQRDIIASQLDKGTNIKYVVTNNNWTSDFDYVPNPTRFPEVYSVLDKDYVPFTGFGQQTVWIRK
ncbi:MAG: hypothetical protein JWN26_169 [Candidatus Saccharibacteria bacterium]|nr:hypothetical protein [Candidatus Saccharibacteria bacterium]